MIDRYEFVNHDCHATDLMPVGRLKTGREVKINRKVHEATFRIGIGSIFPHPMNGFGGGGKILFPGVSDFDSIREHHLKYTFHEGTGLGKTKGNIFYEQVCAIARSAKLDYIINSVLDQKDQVYSTGGTGGWDEWVAGQDERDRWYSEWDNGPTYQNIVLDYGVTSEFKKIIIGEFLNMPKGQKYECGETFA